MSVGLMMVVVGRKRPFPFHLALCWQRFGGSFGKNSAVDIPIIEARHNKAQSAQFAPRRIEGWGMRPIGLNGRAQRQTAQIIPFTFGEIAPPLRHVGSQRDQ